MKRVLVSAAVVVLFATVTLISNSPLKGGDNGRTNGKSEAKEVQIGFSICPVKLNLQDKDPNLGFHYHPNQNVR
jgi:hypothetical protein